MKIRIENDITLRVSVTRLGAEEDFTGKTVRLLVRSTLCTVELPYTLEGNTLVALWKGTEQTKTGTYTVTVVEDYGDGNRNTVDCCGAFSLVSHSCGSALTGDQTVDTTVDITDDTQDIDLDVSVPANGMSAYEIAVAHGFEGTEEEWLESLHGDGLQLGETSTTAFAGDRGVALEQKVAEDEDIDNITSDEIRSLCDTILS